MNKGSKTIRTVVRLLKQKNNIAAKRHIQTRYNTNQKQWDKKSLKRRHSQRNAVLNNSTGQMLNDPEKITEYVHAALKKQARPADRKNQSKGIPAGGGEERTPLGDR